VAQVVEDLGSNPSSEKNKNNNTKIYCKQICVIVNSPVQLLYTNKFKKKRSEKMKNPNYLDFCHYRLCMYQIVTL
jgi:hypothetical protein